MVAKKTAVQQSASGRSTVPAAKDVGGKKSATGAPVSHEARPVKTVSGAQSGSKPAAGGTAPGKADGKKVATKKADGKKADGKKADAKKAAAGKKPAKKAVTGKKAAAKTADAREPGAGKTAEETSAAAGKTPEETGAGAAAEGGATKKTRAKGATARKSSGTAKKSTRTAKKAVASAAEGAAHAAKTTGATTVVAKKTPGTATAAKKPTAVPKARVGAVEPGELAVRPGEDPWTSEEVEEARAELQSEALRLSTEISSSEEALVGLMRDSGDGAGDDQADTGTKNITREHEMALAANAREMLEQTERALDRLETGTYGLCESCGNPIGKARMQAFPRATLCVECKQKQERRY
ncbi:DNA-binding protein [Streptomyces sp. Tue6028]|uniref:TraR/DksA family transcriptional regulator n=1 Tax=Streptomyces sp. Tue6028 TaxID=2036037 RepID=UPI000BB392D0|nr:TraR/DksA family transcriptional regulator [Streptomyces sp. Tue6028]PBC64456.1 DNA-binding protein [Streptomyces sp. Tue6028]